MYPQNEMAALVLAHAFEDELFHIKEAGLLGDAVEAAKEGVKRVARRVKRVHERGSPLRVRNSLGLRTPLQAEQTGRINELNRLALAQRKARRPVYGKGLAAVRESVQRPKTQGTGALGGSGLGGLYDPNNIEAAIQRGREFAARTRPAPLEMPQPTALKATRASGSSQGVVRPIREANRASIQRMRARRDASMRQAGGFGRMID